VALDDALVVEAHQRDHISNVRVVRDSPRGRSAPVWEHGVGLDAPLVFELGPLLLCEEVVRGVVTVEVPDLPVAELERELAAAAVCGWSRLSSRWSSRIDELQRLKAGLTDCIGCGGAGGQGV
jgi:hypothetical protein